MGYDKQTNEKNTWLGSQGDFIFLNLKFFFFSEKNNCLIVIDNEVMAPWLYDRYAVQNNVD